jgi:hypothetical protein
LTRSTIWNRVIITVTLLRERRCVMAAVRDEANAADRRMAASPMRWA